MAERTRSLFTRRENNLMDYIDKLEDDIERLRERVATLHAAEVERDRAREALAMRVEASKTAMAELKRQVDAIRVGNERIAELEAANERLRNDESHLRLQLADAEQDVERLRERGDWAVEQLRLAEAEGEELREQLSLNRVHDRDCVAREDLLRRIEEERDELAAMWDKHMRQKHNTHSHEQLGLTHSALADQPTEEKA